MELHQIAKAKLSDIAPIFNLIQEGSAQGCFSKLYLQPRYQAGLALQLFSVWLFGKIRLPSGAWYKADLQVIRYGGVFAGFALVRHQSPLGTGLEIYMCAIETQHRGKGLGRFLIESVLDNIQDNSIVEAECLPHAVPMKNLLLSMGFRSSNCVEETALMNTAERFCFPTG